MLKMKNRILPFLLSLALLMGLATSAFAEDASTDAQPEEPVRITLLHTNDMHARAVAGTDGGMGFAAVGGIFDSYRANNPHTIVLDAGDAIHGTTFATLVNGESVVQAMNLMGYDAMAPGNHEFNYGTDRLVELAEQMEFPLISANIEYKNGERLFEPYIIKEVAGLSVAIFGLTTPETAYKTHPNNVKDIVFTDPVEQTQAIVDELKGKADIIIALGHIGLDESSDVTSLDIIEAVDGIDIFVDGHSHTVLAEGLEGGNGTLIVSTGEYTKYVGVVELLVQNGEIVEREAKLLSPEDAAEFQPNEATTALVDQFLEDQQAILAEPVGHSTVLLDGVREHVRAGETNLGNLIADSLLYVSGADVALTNGGGIRASIDEGVITKGEVITVLPFGNQIVTIEVTGADIKAALENGVSDYPEPKGAFPQVGGLTFQIDPSADKGNRVHSIKIGGKALDEKAVYTLATNDFIAAGGDEYTMFGKYPQAGMFGALDEALIAYIQEIGTADSEIEGRITEGALPGTTKPEQPKPAPQPKPEPKPEPKPAEPAVYIVKKGDTLWAIARKHGTTWQELAKINKLKNPDLIFPGQKIILPG